MPFTGPWDDLYAAAGDAPCPATWDAPARSGDAPALPPAPGGLRRARTRTLSQTTTPPAGARLAARYWGLASLVDDVRRAASWTTWRRSAWPSDTVVVYSTDHGDMMGEHRLLAKAMPYEGASRVPLLFRVPGLAPRRIATPVSQVDVTPTLLDLLGLPVPPHVQGQSLLPLLRDGDADPQSGEIVFEWSGARPGEGASPVDDRRRTGRASPGPTAPGGGPWRRSSARSAAGAGS